MKRISIGDNVFAIILIFVIMAFVLINGYLDQCLNDECLRAGKCEYVEDEDGEIVVKLKTEQKNAR